LRSDSGIEYTSNDFSGFCKDSRIKRETVSYNPQQNGVAERQNQSIIDSSRAIIHDHELCMFLWEEACNIVVYVQNRSPHWILGDKTREEAFSRVNPEIGHLRILGFPVYIHVPMEKRTKLDPSMQKGICVWYNKTSKDYRMFILAQQKIVVSKYVKFKEKLASRIYQESSIVTEDKEK
jgi:hypothetical protein